MAQTGDNNDDNRRKKYINQLTHKKFKFQHETRDKKAMNEQKRRK